MRSQPAVFSIAILGILSHAYWAAIPVVASVFADRALGGRSSTYGLLLSGMNLGMVAGGLVIGAAGRRWPRDRLVLLGYAGMGIGITTLGLTRAPAQAVVAIACSGAVSMLTVVPFFALLQDLVPDEFRGRVLSTDETLEHGVLPPLYALAGWLSDAAGPRATLWAAGAGSTLPAVRRAR